MRLRRGGPVAVLLAQLLAGCGPSAAPDELFLAQGALTGEVTATSAVLQTRLTATPGLEEGDVPGSAGLARFEVATAPDFAGSVFGPWLSAVAASDHIVKWRLDQLAPGTRYYYRVHYTAARSDTYRGRTVTFRTLPGADREDAISFTVITGPSYGRFHHGDGDPDEPGADAYQGADKALGYPGLAAMAALEPDLLIATGDNVYYDWPSDEEWVATTRDELRRKWHEQLVQPRFVDFFAAVPAYWQKDDHDFRYNDADNTGDTPPSAELGRATFLEQVPLVAPGAAPRTFRTHRLTRDVQLWLTEGRDHRSPNALEDGPGKTLWGAEQRAWLEETLLASDAAFKLLISPTPLIGPDAAYKTDSHANIGGFQYERDEFFDWLAEHGFVGSGFYIICGDRHWQYHSIHPSGLEELSVGALVDANAMTAVLPGDPGSTDPDATIVQPYVQLPGEESGGFLYVRVERDAAGPVATFDFHDEQGALRYRLTGQSGD